MEMHNPLEQFRIITLLPIAGPFSLTNAALAMILVVGGFFLLFTLGLRKPTLVPNRLQSIAELSYEFIAHLLQDTAGKEGLRYFPLVFSLFFFILGCNLVGMLPFGFTVTSHFAVTFALALLVFLTITLVGFIRHGFHFFSLFLPKGTPLFMSPLMVIIELFAYLARPVSLSVRLAANMIAGHTILKVAASFILPLGFIGGWLPFALLIVFTGFEFFVSVLQAYIFVILTCVYLSDVINLH